eukprot:scaffold11699_cov109-Isochrysis_galbana.AAC.8
MLATDRATARHLRALSTSISRRAAPDKASKSDSTLACVSVAACTCVPAFSSSWVATPAAMPAARAARAASSAMCRCFSPSMALTAAAAASRASRALTAASILPAAASVNTVSTLHSTAASKADRAATRSIRSGSVPVCLSSSAWAVAALACSAAAALTCATT